MLAFIFGLTIWPLLGLGVMFCLLLACVYMDVNGRNEPKWWVGVLLLVALVTYDAFTPTLGVWTWNFWMSATPYVAVGTYIGYGLLYSLFEFVMVAWRTKRRVSESWKRFLAANKDELEVDPKTEADAEDRARVLRRFDAGLNTRQIISVSYNHKEQKPGPKLHVDVLTDYVFAWTCFWPFYAVYFVFGRLLEEGIRFIVETLGGLGDRFVKYVFKDVFKFVP